MSAFLNVKLACSQKEDVSPSDIVRILVSNGWNLNDNGQVSYLPIGDVDNYNWTTESMPESRLMNILVEKEKRNEILGISLTWADSNIGGTLLIWSKENLSFSLSINRKIVNQDLSIGITDINWYSEKFITGLCKGGLQIISFSFEQIY